MNAVINYVIEANLGLVFFLIVYLLGLRNENQFSAKRLYLLAAIAFSVVFPLLHFNSRSSEEIIPSVSRMIPSYWLPEVVVHSYGQASIVPSESIVSVWSWTETAYYLIVLVLILVFLFRLVSLLRLIWNSKKYLWRYFLVTESNEDKPTFSFFQFIFIGQAGKLSYQEKEIILNHEAVHIRKLHSVDILLINLLGIIFWFNPAIRIYKALLTQLHEFEADEHSLGDRDLYSYCSLLAKLSLPSTEFSLANHFNNSLTMKRIAMMKSMKRKIQDWKIFPIAAAIGLFFFAVSCQDQVANDLKTITQNTTMTELLPAEVKAYLEKLKRGNPSAEYIVLENTPEGKETIDRLLKNSSKYNIDTAIMHGFNLYPANGPSRLFTILQKGASTNTISRLTASTDKVYTIGEKMASPQNGLSAFQEYLTKNIRYPDSARQAGIEGKVFIEFVVDIDGRLSDFKVLKGIKGGCNGEAIRVLSASPAWKPAEQDGVAVKQRLVMPITYNLAFAEKVMVDVPTGQNEKMSLGVGKDNVNGNIKFEGTVWRGNGQPLAGAHIILKNSTEGTTTGPDGHFQFETTTQQGTLIFSFVGFDSAEYQF